MMLRLITMLFCMTASIMIGAAEDGRRPPPERLSTHRIIFSHPVRLVDASDPDGTFENVVLLGRYVLTGSTDDFAFFYSEKAGRRFMWDISRSFSNDAISISLKPGNQIDKDENVIGDIDPTVISPDAWIIFSMDRETGQILDIQGGF